MKKKYFVGDILSKDGEKRRITKILYIRQVKGYKCYFSYMDDFGLLRTCRAETWCRWAKDIPDENIIKKS